MVIINKWRCFCCFRLVLDLPLWCFSTIAFWAQPFDSHHNTSCTQCNQTQAQNPNNTQTRSPAQPFDSHHNTSCTQCNQTQPQNPNNTQTRSPAQPFNSHHNTSSTQCTKCKQTNPHHLCFTTWWGGDGLESLWKINIPNFKFNSRVPKGPKQ